MTRRRCSHCLCLIQLGICRIQYSVTVQTFRNTHNILILPVVGAVQRIRSVKAKGKICAKVFFNLENLLTNLQKLNKILISSIWWTLESARKAKACMYVCGVMCQQ